MTIQQIKNSKVFQDNLDELFYLITTGFVYAFNDYVYDVMANDIYEADEEFSVYESDFAMALQKFIDNDSSLKNDILNEIIRFFTTAKTETELEEKINELINLEDSENELFDEFAAPVLTGGPTDAWDKLRDLIYGTDWLEYFGIEPNYDDEDEDNDEDYEEDDEEYDESLNKETDPFDLNWNIDK